jgi:hypothetical protein
MATSYFRERARNPYLKTMFAPARSPLEDEPGDASPLTPLFSRAPAPVR